MEQLRCFSFLSGVLAGFAVAALLQLQIDVMQVPRGNQLWFATTAGICVSLYHFHSVLQRRDGDYQDSLEIDR